MTLPIIEAAADYFAIPLTTLLSRSREPRTILARRAVSYVLRERDGMSYPIIARLLKRNDHTSAMHWYACAAEVMAGNGEDGFKAFCAAYMALPRLSRERLALITPYEPVRGARRGKIRRDEGGGQRVTRAVEQPPEPPPPAPEIPPPSYVPTEEIELPGGRMFQLDDDGLTYNEWNYRQMAPIINQKFINKLRAALPQRQQA